MDVLKKFPILMTGWKPVLQYGAQARDLPNSAFWHNCNWHTKLVKWEISPYQRYIFPVLLRDRRFLRIADRQKMPMFLSINL
jgi:hypothetical protein